MVSVIMSTYREPLDYITSSIESVLSQTYTSFEFIVIVDDPNNTDLISLIEKYQAEDNRIKLFVNDKNLGLTGSLNRALQYVEGEYVARMDADDISAPDRLMTQLHYLINKELDLIGSNIQNIDEQGNPIAGASNYPETHDNIIKKARFASPLAHPTWFGKKKVFEELNGYQEIEACEDYDFLIRAILHGFKLGNVQETLLKYRINLRGISSTKKVKAKTASFLEQENYKKGKETTEADYNQFIMSDAGRIKMVSLDSYYKKTAKLKALSGNKIKKLFYGMYIFVSSSEGRALLINLLREKMSIMQ